MSSQEKPPTGGDVWTYERAGVDVDAGERAVQLIKEYARGTHSRDVLAELGSFGGMFDLTYVLDAARADGLKNPVLVSSIDGVGTKLKVAKLTGRFDTVGQDLMHHCINDILTQGAKPLFSLDYYATDKLQPEQMAEVVKGLCIAGKAHGCAVIGGETAEMSDTYGPGEFDLAATIVGLNDRTRIVLGYDIQPGDRVIGLASNGLQTNGYTLARKLTFDVAGLTVEDDYPWGANVGEELLRIHRCYLESVYPLFEQDLVMGAAHITGGGIPGNLIRCLPEGCRAEIYDAKWEVPPIFPWLQHVGQIPYNNYTRAYNLGVGFALVVRADDVPTVMEQLAAMGETAWIIGAIFAGERKVEMILLND